MRLIIFEPLYVSLQTLPSMQVALISGLQLVMTFYTIVCAVRKAYQSAVFAVFRLATEVSILFYLALGFYC